jgi:diguanylate cyclase (GGDEF)-like protein
MMHPPEPYPWLGLTPRPDFLARLEAGFPAEAGWLVAFDVDRLRRFNDDLGSVVGDALLDRAARALRGACAPPVVAARVGGEEFMAWLPGADEAAARALAEGVRAAFAADRFGPDEAFALAGLSAAAAALTAARPTLSAGLAARRAGDVAWRDVLDRAEAALGEAKAAGRDRAIVAR